ncbi:MAG: phosphate starvation-inducible protein PhoH, partial [Gaiellales bacterium]|nr:phosphate starvation-inducible protein PhoH [Gaiellales bacterium]
MATLTFPIDNALAQELGADRDRLLEAVAERAGARIALRGNEVIAEGSDTAVAQVRLLLEELTGLVEQGLPVGNQTVDAIVGVLDADGRAVDVLHDVVWRHRGKRIAPKTLNQKRYVDAIRSSTVTFGVGPAGTGKTYLAMALAVSALVDREVARI